MDKCEKRFRRPTTRRLAQLYAALLYNANLRGFIRGELFTGSTKAVCVPGLNCYSCPGAVAACPLGALQNALASAGHTAPWYILGILLLFGVLLGRTVCGWLCPFGLIQDLLHKLPVPKIRKSRVTRALSYLKYVILAVFVIAVPLYYAFRHGLPLPAFCKYICPAGTLEGAGGLLASPAGGGLLADLADLFTRKAVILLVILLACVFCWRAFCRFLCPLGAIYGLFNRIALIGVKVDADKCTRCGACVRSCQMDVRRVGDRECISCGKCMDACAHGAISIRCGKITLKGPETAHAEKPSKTKKYGRIAWGVLLAVLVFAVVYFNFISVPAADSASPAPEAVSAAPEEWTSDAPVGTEPGQQLADFTCTLTDGTGFRLSDHRGQVVIINQWATYCTPCVAELPYFEQLRAEHPDIVVLAFHHWLEASPEAVPFIEQQGWTDWGVLFAVDTEDMTLMNAVGGDNTMPRTVVLNRRGEIVYNGQRSMTPELLDTLLAQAESD